MKEDKEKILKDIETQLKGFAEKGRRLAIAGRYWEASRALTNADRMQRLREAVSLDNYLTASELLLSPIVNKAVPKLAREVYRYLDKEYDNLNLA